MKRFVMLAALLLVGCAESINVDGIQRAYEECAKHGGLKYVKSHSQVMPDSYPIARCNNGLRLDLDDMRFVEAMK
jgi:hypothetical protein